MHNLSESVTKMNKGVLHKILECFWPGGSKRASALSRVTAEPRGETFKSTNKHCRSSARNAKV